MGKPLKALVIEDSEGDALLLLRLLRNGGYDTVSRRVDNAKNLEAALAEEKWDIAFSDHSMPQFTSLEALEMVKASNADIPFIIVSGSIGEEVAVAAMKAGAQDYLMKSNLARLVAAVDRELKDAESRRSGRQAEHSLLAQKEAMRIAREIQDRLFPVGAPAITGFDTAGASLPAEATGGDYYDFIPSPRTETFVVIGDVTGHGLGPALLMADVRAYLRALAMEHDNLRDLLDRANQLLREDLGYFRFITLLFAALFPSTRTLRYINAGHPSGYVLDSNGNIKTELPANGSALGLNPGEAFPEATELTLAPLDILVFLTDGALEASSSTGEEFGVTRALDVVRRERHRPSAEIIAALFDAVRQFTDGTGLQDDLTAIIIKVRPDTGEQP